MDLPVYADADFCIVGTIDPARLCPKDRLAITWGTTAWRHDFPCCEVEEVWHRKDAVWPLDRRRAAAAGRHHASAS
jgi:4-hydroxy-3-polyprenylbenzoate decarboxylase